MCSCTHGTEHNKHVTWKSLLELLSWCPIFNISHCSSFQYHFNHDDVIKWKHFRVKTDLLWAESTSHTALMFSLICAWRSAWANNRDTGDWVRHRTNYDVTVMSRNVLYFDRTRYSWRYEWINISPGIYNMLTSCWQLYCKANRSWAKENTIQQIKTFTADIFWHHSDVIMSTVASQITGVSIVC